MSGPKKTGPAWGFSVAPHPSPGGSPPDPSVYYPSALTQSPRSSPPPGACPGCSLVQGRTGSSPFFLLPEATTTYMGSLPSSVSPKN